MAVDFMRYASRNRMDDEDPGPSPNPSLSMVIEEAEAAVGLKRSMEHLIHILSSSSSEKESNMVKKRSLTGHARFRRGGGASPSPQNNQSVDTTSTSKGTKQCDDSMSMSLSMSSSITTNTTAAGGGVGEGDGSVSNGVGIGKQLQQGSAAPYPWSAAKPPLAASNRPRKRPSDSTFYTHHSGGQSSSHNHCHCHSKRRKHDVKRRIKIKVASSYMEIPPDEYAWKKYGQKPIHGSPHHRGYYRCSSAKGCPARKTVERSHHDPTLLIVTYGGEHRHSFNYLPVSSSEHL